MTSVKTVVLMQPCKPFKLRPQTRHIQSTIMQFPERLYLLWQPAPLVRGKGAESLFVFDSKESLMRWPGPCSLSTGPPLVIGSPCTEPPGRCGSPCRGKGADILRWSRRSWTAVDPAAGHIQHAPLRRQGRDGSSRIPLPHTGSPAWMQDRFKG